MNSTAPLRQDASTIGLIGLAHGTSHFFHLLLPPLFPLFIRDFGFSYSGKSPPSSAKRQNVSKSKCKV